MTPPTPAPEPRRDGASVATTEAPPTGPLPALPGIDSDAAVRAAGAAARTPRRAPRREPHGPVTDGATALAPVPTRPATYLTSGA